MIGQRPRPSGPSDLTQHGALDGETFEYIRRLLHEETGICLSEKKRAFVAGRLARRLRGLGIKSFADYCQKVRSDGEGERRQLFEALCTHETRFFREPRHFEYLSSTLIPHWQKAAQNGQKPRRVRIWSAGCATGEEAYSLAMTLQRGLPDGAEILATDLSTRALATAQDAVYSLARVGEIPEPYLKAFMTRGRGRWEGQMRVGPELRAMVRFETLNLHRTPYRLGQRFDAIFCRNVLIYFDAATRARVARALLAELSAEGLLFVGHAEGLMTLPVAARSVVPSVYAKAREERAT